MRLRILACAAKEKVGALANNNTLACADLAKSLRFWSLGPALHGVERACF